MNNYAFAIHFQCSMFYGLSYNLCHLLGSLFIRVDAIVKHSTFTIAKEAVQVNDL